MSLPFCSLTKLVCDQINNLLTVLIHHLHVDDDVPESGVASKHTLTEKSEVVMLIKLQVLQTMDYIFELWQSTQLHAIVTTVALDLTGARQKQSNSDGMQSFKDPFENPLAGSDEGAESPVAATFEMEDAPSPLSKSLKSPSSKGGSNGNSSGGTQMRRYTTTDIESGLAGTSFDTSYMATITAATDSILLFATSLQEDARMRDKLASSLLEIMKYEHAGLRMQAFNALCFVKMPSSQLLDLMGSTQVLTTVGEGLTCEWATAFSIFRCVSTVQIACFSCLSF